MIHVEDTLRYAACLLACAVAGADGRIQNEEKDQLQAIINRELVLNSKSFRYAGILSNLIQHGETLKPNYSWALSELKKNEKLVTPQFKQQVIGLIQRIAEVFPPVTQDEGELVKRIRQEVESIGVPQPQA